MLKEIFKPGDKIIELALMKPVKNKVQSVELYDYKKIDDFSISSGIEFIEYISNFPDEYIEITARRGDQIIKKTVKTQKKKLVFGTTNFSPKEFIEYYPVGEAFKRSIIKTGDLIVSTFQVIGKIFAKKIEARDALGGPITIWRITVEAAKLGHKHYLLLLAMISLNLGFINLLPIPVIDGGHITIYLYEMISGKMPSERVLNIIQHIGLAFIIFLMIFTFYIDIIKML